VCVVISGSDPPAPEAAALVAAEFAGAALADPAGVGAGEAAADGASDCAALAEPLTSVALPSADLRVFGAGPLAGVGGFPAASGDDVVAGGFGPVGGAAVPDAFVALGAEEFPCAAVTGAFCDPAPPCDPLPGGTLCAGGGGAGFCFFSSEGL
jgi:hypothetical protein